MWCIAEITAEYRERMYDLLELYAKPYDAEVPVICVDEKSKQLLGHGKRTPLPMKPGKLAKEDYEYVRNGTRNIFVAVEPRGGKRIAQVTRKRKKKDFVAFIQHLAKNVYASAKKIRIVLDNLNTHFVGSFIEILGEKQAKIFLRRIEFYYTPKHASWLNMAEIEIGVMDRQCLNRRLPSETMMQTEVAAWEHQRNLEKRMIEWTFTRQDADRKLSRHYV